MASIEGTSTKSLPEARKSAKEAGYLELKNATKTGDCSEVNVPGGVSFNLACCNEFQAESDDTDRFSCGTCRYKREK